MHCLAELIFSLEVNSFFLGSHCAVAPPFFSSPQVRAADPPLLGLYFFCASPSITDGCRSSVKSLPLPFTRHLRVLVPFFFLQNAQIGFPPEWRFASLISRPSFLLSFPAHRKQLFQGLIPPPEAVLALFREGDVQQRTTWTLAEEIWF